jgi:hypothetical protein
MENPRELRLAVLIDAENVPYSGIKRMLEEIAKYGTPTFKRIYADWTKPSVSGWKNVLLENAITPVQQYSYTSGKNSTDSALIIDAMDILYTGRVEGFCIMSSDSDFTRLATRLREAGMRVFGFGEKKTPSAFITACDKFVYLEILKSDDDPPAPVRKKAGIKAGDPKKAPAKPKVESLGKLNKETLRLITESLNDLADENGWTYLGDLGTLLIKKQPDFDPRNFGFKKLYPLIKSIGGFEVDERNTGKGNIMHVYVKNK